MFCIVYISTTLFIIDALFSKYTTKDPHFYHHQSNVILPLLVINYIYTLIRASLVAQTVKNMPAMGKTWVQSLGWEDPLEKGMGTHSSILAWRIPRTEEPGGCSPWGPKESDTAEWLSTAQHKPQFSAQISPIISITEEHVDCGFPGGSVAQHPPAKAGDTGGTDRLNPWVMHISWRSKWQSTPAVLQAELYGQRSLEGYSPWGHTELNMT